MQVARAVWNNQTQWVQQINGIHNGDRADLVLIFGSSALMKDNALLAQIRKSHPKAYICGCSTAGEIAGDHVIDDSMTATAVKFDSTTVRAVDAAIAAPEESFSIGKRLAHDLKHDGLAHVFILSDGLSVNGSELVKGVISSLPEGVSITGGLSGDGDRFSETYVCTDGVAAQKRIVLLGFYGARLKVGYGSMGGWDMFGPERCITRSKSNVLYELDGRSALDLYKEYLGAYSDKLPASGLLFPLGLRDKHSDETIVRTILGIDEKAQSMTFAGDMPEGNMARFMRANFDRLVEGANKAAVFCRHKIGNSQAQLAILISCVGRKLVLRQRIEEEVETVSDVLGKETVTTGFYSYGEISPSSTSRCALHNQTMTITTFGEI
ncbi:MAG TPA: FIST N-terminal domain-containing protein [Phycisphaerae bacterium]|nr:FIST N-terminal domain-containing protein [Phycisphaerae bacterium]